MSPISVSVPKAQKMFIYQDNRILMQNVSTEENNQRSKFATFLSE